MTKSVDSELADLELPVERGCPFTPPAAYERLREKAPINRIRLVNGGEAWWVSGHEEGRAILADRRFSSDKRKDGFPLFNVDAATLRQLRSQPPHMLSMDGNEHAAARRPVIGEFTVKRLAALRPRIQDIVDRFIDDMLAADQRPVDLVQALSLPVPSLVICELLGAPYTDHDFFQGLTAVAVRRTSSPQERQRAFAELRAYLDELITRKESEPGDDLFGRQIARQRQEGTLDHAGLVSLAFLLLTAGHETTANMISLGVVGLLSHPEQLALIKADPGRTPMAVEELLRYFSITDTVSSRLATDDVEIAGVSIKAGEGVIVSGLSANWDPAVFENPAELDVERGVRHHLAFGFGPHQCLGQNLARMELQIVFDTLFRRIPTLRLAVPAEEVPFKTDAVIYGVHELPVTW
ncbi:cytochrome P450 [Nonomuraea dietziae]|uniref:Cytochrome P450 n=1 Tax=Nonomuraea dietziae TaxID=65515 RepID=M4JUH9_9ACTN|nr:cytochrome P450 [Nonomuraea dietziae]AGE14540.1 cytochrome P450 hydroxylase sb1 [Nonomuraea dietziae]MBB3724553.1 cytochrome P450 [Nonomuraea dietziae]